MSEEKIKFSFEYYDTAENGKYCISCWRPELIKKSLKRLKEINAKSFHQLLRESRVLHTHEVDWKKTIGLTGFPDRRANNMSPFQFALLGINNGRARVFGAYSTNIFYIVWFDLNHTICPTKLKNT